MISLQSKLPPETQGTETLLRRRPTRQDMLDLYRTGRHLQMANVARCEGNGECIAEANAEIASAR